MSASRPSAPAWAKARTNGPGPAGRDPVSDEARKILARRASFVADPRLRASRAGRAAATSESAGQRRASRAVDAPTGRGHRVSAGRAGRSAPAAAVPGTEADAVRRDRPRALPHLAGRPLRRRRGDFRRAAAPRDGERDEGLRRDRGRRGRLDIDALRPVVLDDIVARARTTSSGRVLLIVRHLRSASSDACCGRSRRRRGSSPAAAHASARPGDRGHPFDYVVIGDGRGPMSPRDRARQRSVPLLQVLGPGRSRIRKIPPVDWTMLDGIVPVARNVASQAEDLSVARVSVRLPMRFLHGTRGRTPRGALDPLQAVEGDASPRRVPSISLKLDAVHRGRALWHEGLVAAHLPRGARRPVRARRVWLPVRNRSALRARGTFALMAGARTWRRASASVRRSGQVRRIQGVGRPPTTSIR